jgi:hypothetical protein
MSGSNYTVSCPKCGVVNILRGKAMTLALTCQSCNIYFCTGSWNPTTVEFQHNEPQALPIGARGRIDNFVYEVMGFVIKQESKYHYRWREYLLFNPYRGYAFLSEYNGHWNFIWPVEDDPRANSSDNDFINEDSHYQLYQRYSASVLQAKGEFFFDIFDITPDAINYEFIAPPYLFALERSHDSILWCKGEYFTPDEIANAFSIPKEKLPSKTGVGYTQPFNSAFSEKSLILFTVLIFMVTLFFQLLINNSAADKVVFQADYNQNELKDQKLIVTPSFELQGGTKSLEIYLYSYLSNNWFFSEFTLVSETDGTEYNFTKEIEYYWGADDGGSWTEGSKNGEAFLSQIPEGKYHLNIYPEFSFTNQSFSITVSHDVPMQSNFYITCLGVLLFPAFYFIRKRRREKKRWSDSEYSPYETE